MTRVQCMPSPSKRLICAGMLSPHNFPLDASKHRCQTKYNSTHI